MKKLQFYTSNEISAKGWLERQLRIQAQGLNGKLDKVWRDVRDSKWIGGEAEGWERVPYWLDGFIPLAYLLDDADMIVRAKKYIDAIVANQREDGWICPCSEEEIEHYDTWAVQLITKVLVNYYECSRDSRIPEVVYKILKNYYGLFKSGRIRLFGWGAHRWYETFVAINFIKERYDEPWLAELAAILKEQGTDYDEVKHLWKKPLNKWIQDTHIVNIVMMLKSEAVSHELLGEEYTDKAEQWVSMLDEYNGTPVGLFTGDECLSGLSPIQGTELCAVVEQMYSYELLYAYTHDPKWAERLELLAFNALPATISDDMWTHQYLQQSNQISCERFPGKSLFRTNNSEAHLFGLEPNFGCCTANFGQGWPKLVLSTFMHDGDKIINVLPIPSRLDTGKTVIEVCGDYPFKNGFKYKVNTDAAFALLVRIPSSAKNVRVDSEHKECQGMLRFDFEAGESREISIRFDTDAVLVDRPYGLKSLKRGSLVFSLPIEYEKRMHEYERDGVERKFPYCDYEYVGKSEWRYGYASDIFSAEERELSDIPFSSERPPLVLRAEVARIAWDFEDGYDTAAAKLPLSTEALSQTETVELYPYGCAKLRMTELPLVNGELGCHCSKQ